MPDTADPSERPGERRPPSAVLGICGLVLAFLGLGLAGFAPQIVRVAAPARPGPQAAAEPGKRLASRLKLRVHQVEVDRPVATLGALRSRLRLASSVAGLIAILLGALSAARREGIWISLLPALVGSAAIAWPYVLAGTVLST